MRLKFGVISIGLIIYFGRQAILQNSAIERTYVDSLLVLCIAAYFLFKRYLSTIELAAFDRQFPIMKNGYLQHHIFQGPLRATESIKDMKMYRDYVIKLREDFKAFPLSRPQQSVVDALSFAISTFSGSANATDKEVKRVHDAVRDAIRATDTCQNMQKGKKFSEAELDSVLSVGQLEESELKPVTSRNKLYTSASNDSCFLSIDMREANFTSLRILAKLYADNSLECHGWSDFMRKITNIPFLQTNKRFRQIVLGTVDKTNVLNQAVASVQKHLLARIAKVVMQANQDHNLKLTLHCLVSDEAVFAFHGPTSRTVGDEIAKTIHQAIVGALHTNFRFLASFIRVDTYEVLYLNSVNNQARSVRLMRSLTMPNQEIVANLDSKGLSKHCTLEEAAELQGLFNKRVIEYTKLVTKQGREPFIPLELLV